MFSTKLTKIYLNKCLPKRMYVDYKHPFQRTWNAITNDNIFKKNPDNIYPEHTDVVIIGGGFLGTSGAYWLKTRASEGLNVVILDKNFNQKPTNRNMSLGILSQHYSLPENIMLSQFTADFLRNIKEKLNKDVDIKFYPHGYLVLASDKYAEILEKNVAVLKEYGIKNELLSVDQLKKKYPWMNTSDVKLGCLSTENEGVFDSNALLQGMVQKCQKMGVNYVQGEVVGFEMERQSDVLMEGVKPMSYQKIYKVIYKTQDNETRDIKFAICVLAAGTESSNIARMAHVGNKSGLLSIPLPVEKRESNVYSIENNNCEVGLNTPLIMDTSGLWLRRNGLQNNLICGQIPLSSEKSLSAEESYELLLKPSLQNRFPNFHDVKINNCQSEEYDCNTYDDSGIIGPHPYHTNLILATGFGRLGVQHSPAIGRAISDLIIDSQYTCTDLTRLGFDRILINEPLVDFNIY